MLLKIFYEPTKKKFPDAQPMVFMRACGNGDWLSHEKSKRTN
jgi:hypothetical protein